MISKLFLLLFVLVRLAVTHSEDGFSRSLQLHTVQNEIFAKISSYTRASWNQTESRQQNFHIFPILVKIRHYVALVKLFYKTGLDRYFTQNKFLRRPYALAHALVKLQNTSNVELRFSSAIFYDRRYSSWQFLEDLKTHYSTEAYEISFDPQNEQSVITLINNWTFRSTLGRQSKTSDLRVIGMDNYFSTILSFKGCWDITKTTRFETGSRPRRFIPTIPLFAAMRLEEEIDVPSFSAKETIGYFNNAEKKYEAIRIAFNNEEYAMAVVLPYYNHSLEIFTNFTVADYRKLLQQVNTNYENVHYTIPMINSSTFSINEKGVVINRNKVCDYTVVRDETFDNRDCIYHKPFFVDRPYGMLIYHEKTSIVLMYALVRNPISGVWPISKFQLRLNMFGEVEDVQNIS